MHVHWVCGALNPPAPPPPKNCCVVIPMAMDWWHWRQLTHVCGPNRPSRVVIPCCVGQCGSHLAFLYPHTLHAINYGQFQTPKNTSSTMFCQKSRSPCGLCAPRSKALYLVPLVRLLCHALVFCVFRGALPGRRCDSSKHRRGKHKRKPGVRRRKRTPAAVDGCCAGRRLQLQRNLCALLASFLARLLYLGQEAQMYLDVAVSNEEAPILL